ncbi:MAG: 3'(2'),5'-bisphosphate nucleotidase CysQ [Gammaproteobacteria bacterium]|nr:3'(2'),5'-bisphosphate nucleotidase CysQ [Gammaproteobacteria bacterium]MCP5135809.1 3'(2'),5'-bisphosphate nucleotidase CysQ [Gammaproteobacteria bacterium]
MFDRLPLADWLSHVIPLARHAGARIMEVYERPDFDVQRKGDDSPLTAADLAAHNAIVEGLSKLTPDIPILSEESAKIDFSVRSAWRTYWLVDPLDGTKEFIKRNGEFTVNIALIHDHAPVLGVVYAPVLDITYAAAKGSGARMQRGNDEFAPIHVTARESRPLRVVGSRSHAGDLLGGFLENLADDFGGHEMVSMGSSLKLCLVAEGMADLYPRLGPTSEWDTAAAHAVVAEAGGTVTDLSLAPLRYNTKESLLNPYFLVFREDGPNWAQYLPENH